MILKALYQRQLFEYSSIFTKNPEALNPIKRINRIKNRETEIIPENAQLADYKFDCHDFKTIADQHGNVKSWF